MVKIFGSMLCKDCVECHQKLTEAGVEFQFLDFADDLQNLKDFLRIRDTEQMFEPFRGEGKIGIPCMIKEDGTITLDLDDLL